MKLFGHHVVLPAVVLALVDGLLFIATLYVLGFVGPCTSCVMQSVAHLTPGEALLLTLAFVLITASVGLYNRDSLLEFRIFIRRFFLASQFVLIPAVAFVGVVKAASGLPFGWYIGILTVVITLFFAVLLTVRIILRWGLDFSFLKRRVLVLGNGPTAEAVIDLINNQGRSHLKCVGRIKNGRTTQNTPVVDGNVVMMPKAETETNPITVIANSMGAEEITVAVRDKRGLPVWELLEAKLQGILVTDYLDFWERETGRIDLTHAGAGWLALGDGFRLSWSRKMVKRTIDVVVSLAFLTVIFPLACLVALLIKLESRGPVFYKQERVGLNGETFLIWKFRSMRENAEQDGVPRWANSTDDRITRVGWFIRKFRIDEIPQVINVLKGDMSFIGPRPERPYFDNQLRRKIGFYDLRYRVRPGITGWAQVNYVYGASEEDARIKLAYDLYYVKNQDIVLDFFILIQTVRVILFSHGSR